MALTLPHIAGLVLNRPLLLLPSKLDTIAAVLGGRIGIDASDLTREASRFVGSQVDRDTTTGASTGLPYKRTADGVGIVPVLGSLVNRGAWIGPSCGFTSFEGLKYQVSQAAADTKTRAIILDLDSPGGEAVGCFEAADVVRQAAARKPVVAVVNGMACSAAFAIASAATRIVTTPSGISGSIGVVLMHADVSGALSKAGVKPTLIFAGAHKVDGHAYAALPDAVKADLQAEIEAFYGAFIECVAAGRKNLSAAAIRGTEARTFMGAAAVAAGLADGIGTFESALADLSAGRVTTTTSQGTPTVTHTSRQPGASGPAQAGTLDWDGIVDNMNAKAGLSRGPNSAAIYASRRAASGQQPVTQASPSHSRSGVDVTAIYASRQEQAAASQSASASGVLDWDEIADRMNAKAGLQRGPNPSSIYAARRAQSEGGR